MPPKIEVFPKPTGKLSREQIVANQLKEVFSNELKDAEGVIHIHTNMTLYTYSPTYREVDILVLAQFDSGVKRRVKSTYERNDKTVAPYEEYDVYFQNFCLVIEVKDHPTISTQGQTVFVTTRGRVKNATDQSDGQKNGLRNLFQSELNFSVAPTNLIWFPNISQQDLPPSVPNLLGTTVKLRELLEHLCKQKMPKQSKSGRSISYSCTREILDESFGELNAAIERLSLARESIGALSRQRLERVTRKILNRQSYLAEIGKKAIVLKGRAGTGKTIRLLNLAHNLASEQGDHVVILTYNRALVSDMRRTCALSGINQSDYGLVEIYSIHQLVGVLKEHFPVSPELTGKFYENYHDIVEEIAQYIESGVLNKEELDVLKMTGPLAATIVMIDEGQDWDEREKRLIFAVFGHERVMVADGIDQLVRGSSKLEWASGLSKDQVYATKPASKSLRQKANLCRFVAGFCEQMELPWNLTPNDELTGGRVIVLEGMYSKELHQELFSECKSSGNGAYEMLFMVPPDLVVRDDRSGRINRQFKYGEDWQSWGIKIWDGTSHDVRREYPSDVEEHRVVQYDSCRGLEAWSAVCLNLDMFFEYKMKNWSRSSIQLKSEGELVNDGQDLGLYSDDEERRRFAARWCLMPLTRAIDTLVISVANSASPAYSVLKELHNEFEDFVEWRTL